MEWAFLGQFGLALAFGLAAMGSSLGIIAAGKAAAGAWAKEAKAGMALRFNYIIFVGAPISQTFYAMIVMFQMAKVLEHASSSAGLMLSIGLATGISEMVSAWGQGLIGAAACRCLSEGEGKGLAFLLIAIGIIETVGIFTMVFMLMLAGSIAG
jgi:V/A-type H+-transporting ATPase subunit K